MTLARPHWICLTDAAGASRLIAAAVCGPHGLFFVRAKVPDWLWCQFLPCRGNQIGVQEALAVWLLVTDFKKLLGGALFTLYVDTDEFRLHISKVPPIRLQYTPEGYLLVFRSREHLHPMISRVESTANLADGPTRPDDVGCSLLRELGAAELPAYLPGWLANLWHPAVTEALTCEDILLGWADRA